MIIYFIIFISGLVLGIIISCGLYNISQKFFYFGNAWKKYGNSVIRNERGDETIEPLENIIFMLDKKIEIDELVKGA